MLWVSVLSLACSGEESDAGATPDGPRLLSDQFLNIAHRGGRALRPEHTLLAYQHALDVNADILELDVHATSDGVLVLMHDDTVDRTTDGTGAIKDLTFAELSALDAGYSFGDGSFPYRGQGIRVPSLEQVFDAFPEAEFVIELKQAEPSIVEPFVELCRSKGMLDKISAGSFNVATTAALRLAEPSIPSSFALGEVINFVDLTAETEAEYQPPGKFLQVPPEQLGLTIISPEFIARAARFDLKIHAWTINDREEMEALIDMGVDGIITDDPVLLDSVRHEKGK